MKNKLSVLAVGLLFVISACQKETIEKVAPGETITKSSGNVNGPDGQNFAKQDVRNFRTHLTGGQEVPSNDSRATGQAIFQLSKDGTELSYKLIVANISNVTMAHIHLAPAGANGPVVLWLYPSAPPAQLIPGRVNGVIGEGVVTEANLVGQLAGQPLSALIEHIVNGNAYVNVHTSQFPGGEVRGQL
jgi:hypothetical protein